MRFYRPLRPLRALTFDLDDTLYDNRPVIARTERESLLFLQNYHPALKMLDAGLLSAHPGRTAPAGAGHLSRCYVMALAGAGTGHAQPGTERGTSPCRRGCRHGGVRLLAQQHRCARHHSSNAARPWRALAAGGHYQRQCLAGGLRFGAVISPLCCAPAPTGAPNPFGICIIWRRKSSACRRRASCMWATI